ncbi:GtrA family protein [Paenibacillus sp. DYY-L-2]|uniref:GtrA family protein n=1 Tax=Paenibacillus sp. DYY-L-2 TaxID=3447013 RepID=UPI003F4F997B
MRNLPDKRRWAETLRRPSTIQFIKFNLVGVMNTAVDFAVFTALASFGTGSGVAQVFSYSAGILNSFLMNKRVTFKDYSGGSEGRSAVGSQFFRFIVLNALVLAVSLALLQAAVTLMEAPVLYAKAAVTCVTMGLNFYGSRRWVFRERQYISGD